MACTTCRSAKQKCIHQGLSTDDGRVHLLYLCATPLMTDKMLHHVIAARTRGVRMPASSPLQARLRSIAGLKGLDKTLNLPQIRRRQR